MFQVIVTSQDKISDLIRLFTSLSTQPIKTQVIFVNQTSLRLSDFFEAPERCDTFSILEIRSRKCSLSAARNKALPHILPGSIVAFADDDCWYSQNVVEKIWAEFASDSLDCVCVNVFDPERNKFLGNRPVDRRSVGLGNIFRLPISVGIFVCSDFLLSHNLEFNEDYGIGAKYGSGEETDLIFRMIICGAKVRYFGDIVVFHPAIESHENIDILKTFNYAVGFGKLNKKFFAAGYVVHFPYLLSHVCKSFLGILVKPRSRAVYMARLRGTLLGLFT